MRLAALLFLILMTPLIHAKTIIIGTLSNDPPFEMQADQQGHVFGFDIAIMTEICKRMKVTCEFKFLPFKQIFTEIDTGAIDLGMAAINISPERQALYLFSMPYLASAAQFVASVNSGINQIEDLAGKKVGILEGSLYRAAILDKDKRLSKIVEYPGISEVFEALAGGDIDAVITDKAVAVYWTSNNSSLFKLIGNDISMGMGYGIMANRNNTSLIGQINKALLEMESDEAYIKIYNRYFGVIAPSAF